MIQTFRCYSANLKDFLKTNGMDWIVIALDIVAPHKQYWLFEKNEMLKKLLDKWDVEKPK